MGVGGDGADLRRHFTENQIKILVCMSEKVLHMAACEENANETTMRYYYTYTTW